MFNYIPGENNVVYFLEKYFIKLKVLYKTAFKTNCVSGDLVEEILERVQRHVAFSVVAPVASLIFGPNWYSLFPPAAIRVVAGRVSTHNVVWINVDVC